MGEKTLYHELWISSASRYKIVVVPCLKIKQKSVDSGDDEGLKQAFSESLLAVDDDEI